MTPRPVFIVGSGRSGTSALTWALGQHPNIIGVPETNWLSGLACYAESFYRAGAAAGVTGHVQNFRITEDTMLQEFGRCADTIVRNSFVARFKSPFNEIANNAVIERGLPWLRSADEPKERWVDGTPSSTAYAGVLAKMLPEALFVNLIRNPVDVVRSTLGFPHRAALGLADPNNALHFVYHHQRAGFLAEAALEPKVLRVRFEDLIGNPETTISDILAFMGEEFTPVCLEPLARGKINATSIPSPEIDAELEGLLSDAYLEKMRGWHQSASDREWRIAPKKEAVVQLGEYAKFRLALPIG